METLPRFHLDVLTPACISGWGHRAGEPLTLLIRVNGAQIAQLLADRYRPDVAAAGFGNGRLSFLVSIRAPGLLPGDLVEITETGRGTLLHKALFDRPRAPEIDMAYELQRDVAPIDRPFWRPALVESGSGRLSLRGALFQPAGAGEPGLRDETGGPGEVLIAPTSAEVEGRFWWLDGRCYEAQYEATGDDRRVIVRPSASTLDMGVIPSRQELAQFRFPGSERARRVAGGADGRLMFAGGSLTSALQLLSLAGALPEDACVLDWGCGAGRVLQFVKAERPRWMLHGVDIDAVNLNWCLDNLADLATFRAAPLQPPLHYADASFDFVYGLSVITHLEEATRNAWIGELARVTRPGGTCVLTYQSVFHLLIHGITEASYPVYADVARRGISDRINDPALGADLSLYYRATFNTFENIQAVVSERFDIAGHYPRALLDQDTLLLLRK